MNLNRKVILMLVIALVATSVFITVPTVKALPTEVWVDDDYTPATPGWGYDHFNSIQAGINAVDSGGKVNVAAGTYQENLAAWKDMEITKSLSLIGSGSGTTIIQLSEGNSLPGGKMNGVEIRGSNLEVRLQGLLFTKRPGNTHATSFPLRIAETASSFTKLTMIDVEVAYAEASDVILGGNGVFTEVYIEDCYFHHAGTWGFLGSGTINKITVINSDFEYNGQVDPAHGNGFDLTGPSSTNVLVDGGSFSYNKQAGINLMQVSNAIFTNLVANNNIGASGGGFGIKLDEWGGKSQNILIDTCIASDNGLDGIVISPEKPDAIDNVRIVHSQLTGNGRDGLDLVYINSGSNNPQMTDISISCSQIFGNGAYGVQAWAWWVPMTITEVFNAENNWWGSPSGPGPVGPGTGDKVTDHVDFTPWKHMHSNVCQEYYLTVTSAYDTPTGAGWYDAGSVVTASVDPSVGHELATGWTGTGSVPPSGTGHTVTFTITQDSSITWNWKYTVIGGEWGPITLQTVTPINTLQLMTPWIILALLAVASVVIGYRRFLKKRF